MPSKEKKVVLVTGGSGLIGQAICKTLSQNYLVVSLDLKKPRQSLSNVTHINLDISSQQSIGQMVFKLRKHFGSHIASVIHLAAYYSFSDEQSSKYDEITVRGTERLLQALREFQVDQFVFSSTMLIHTPSQPGQEVSENSPIDPKWAYPQSKVDAEHVIEREHKSIPYVLLRIAGVYTDRCQSIPIAHQIERIYERHLTGHFYPAELSRGQAFIHLDDLAEAITLVVNKRHELPFRTTVLLGEDEALSYGELQELVSDQLHKRKWKTLRIPKPMAKVGAWLQERIPLVEEPFIKPWMISLADDHYDLDITKAKTLLGWQPKHFLRDEIPKMIQELKRNPQTWYRNNKLNLPSRIETLARNRSTWIISSVGLGVLGAWIWKSRGLIKDTFSNVSRGKAA